MKIDCTVAYLGCHFKKPRMFSELWCQMLQSLIRYFPPSPYPNSSFERSRFRPAWRHNNKLVFPRLPNIPLPYVQLIRSSLPPWSISAAQKWRGTRRMLNFPRGENGHISISSKHHTRHISRGCCECQIVFTCGGHDPFPPWGTNSVLTLQNILRSETSFEWTRRYFFCASLFSQTSKYSAREHFNISLD